MMKCSEIGRNENKQDRQFTYNIQQGRVVATNFAAKKQYSVF
jgi:hypothetical protein